MCLSWEQTMFNGQTNEELACFCGRPAGGGGEQEGKESGLRESAAGEEARSPRPPPPHFTSLNLVADSSRGNNGRREMTLKGARMLITSLHSHRRESPSLSPSLARSLSRSLARRFDFHSFQSEESLSLVSCRAAVFTSGRLPLGSNRRCPR